MLNAPAYSKPDDEIGFVTRVYKGLKENGAIFSHPNPWAWAAECVLGRGDRAMELYDALCPYWQNDKIETRKAEPYSYCQFVTGRDHAKFGEAHHPFMTGTGGWSYVAATRWMLGIRPDLDVYKRQAKRRPIDLKRANFFAFFVILGYTYYVKKCPLRHGGATVRTKGQETC